jgi:hypothetical protein
MTLVTSPGRVNVLVMVGTLVVGLLSAVIELWEEEGPAFLLLAPIGYIGIHIGLPVAILWLFF